MWQRLRLRRLQLIAAFLVVLVVLATVIGATGLGSRSSAPTRPGGRPPQHLRPAALTYDSVSSAIRSALK